MAAECDGYPLDDSLFLLSQHHPRNEIGMVFHLGNDNLVSLADILFAPATGQKIDRLSRAAGKDDFVRAIEVFREPNPEEPELPLAADLRGRVFASTEPGTLSDAFQLPDGRWAFYEVTYYRPAGKEDISQEGTKFRCRRLAWAEYLSSDEVNLRALEWLAALRAKHDVTLAPELYAGAAATVNSR